MASRGRLWLRRVSWLVAIWTVSVTALGVVAIAIRILMAGSGMTS